MSKESIKNHAAFIWSVADLLRGDYKQSEYGRVILPLVVLRRLDCVLEPTKAAVLKRKGEVEGFYNLVAIGNSAETLVGHDTGVDSKWYTAIAAVTE